jgi:hypothetical protein
MVVSGESKLGMADGKDWCKTPTSTSRRLLASVSSTSAAMENAEKVGHAAPLSTSQVGTLLSFHPTCMNHSIRLAAPLSTSHVGTFISFHPRCMIPLNIAISTKSLVH